MLHKTMCDNKPTKTQIGRCWKVVYFMVKVFLREPKKEIVGV